MTKYTTDYFKKRISEINKNIYVIGEYKGAIKKIEWICKICNENNNSTPNSLLNGSGCMHCRWIKQGERQRKTTGVYEKEIYSFVGDEYTVKSEYEGTEIKIKMLHEKCGFLFYMTPHNFLSGQRCPKCNGGVRKKSSYYFRKEVKELTDSTYSVLDDYKGIRSPLNFKHIECGKTFETTPTSFLHQETRCPYCYFISKGELEVKMVLEKLNIEYIQQKTFYDLKIINHLRFDFYIPKTTTCIEFDGSQHFEVKEHWGGIKEFKAIQKRDSMKNEYCKNNGIKLIRVHYKTRNIKSYLRGCLNV